MNLRDLQYFAAVAELEGFGRAADMCGVSQPALSERIKKLEDELGVTLFERGARQATLTEAGRKILVYAKRALRETDAMRDAAAEAKDPFAGKFRLGAFPTISGYVFPAIASKVRAALPDLRLILAEEKTASLLEKLKSGELDAAFLATPVTDDALLAEPLFDDPFLLAVPEGHPLANRSAVAAEELVSHRLLLLEEGHCLRDQALDLCRIYGAAEDPDFRATSMETLREMTRAGAGLTLIPVSAARRDEPGIAYVPFAPPAPVRRISLARRKRSLRGKVTEALARLAEAPCF